MENEYAPLMHRVPDLSMKQGLSANTYCMSVFNKLEGIKTRLKEMHWAGRDGRDLVYHRFIDDVSDAISSYEDALGENIQAIIGKITVGTLSPILPDQKDLMPLLQSTKQLAEEIESKYKHDVQYAGVININEGFLSEINKLIYLAGFIC